MAEADHRERQVPRLAAAPNTIPTSSTLRAANSDLRRHHAVDGPAAVATREAGVADPLANPDRAVFERWMAEQGRALLAG